jgi:hypothetical protein
MELTLLLFAQESNAARCARRCRFARKAALDGSARDGGEPPKLGGAGPAVPVGEPDAL